MNDNIIKGVFLLILAFLSGPCIAQVPDKPYNYINDYSNILTNEEEKYLNDSLRLFEEKASKKIYVLIIGSAGVEDYTELTQKIADKWRIGQNNKDNSVLVAFYYKKRKIRIQVGSGLESVINENTTADIISYRMTPLIKEGQYYKATLSGVNALMQASMGKYKPQQDVGANQGRLLIFSSGIAFVFCIILFFLFLSKYKRLKKLPKNEVVLHSLESFHWKWIPTAIVFGIFFMLVLNYFALDIVSQNIGFLIPMFVFFILVLFFVLNLIALLRKDGLNINSTGNSAFGSSLSLGSNH
jgi:uncharacterized membrane protein YgcG